MKIGIGIDTGGTYTDAVIFDFESKTIRKTAKALTTKEDLSIGILEALSALPADLVKEAEVISLATTLATNACVEDRGGRAKLAFFGGDSKILTRLGAKYGLPPVDEIYLQKSYTKFSGEMEQEPDWDMFCANIDTEFQDLDSVGIIEMNAMKNSAVVEKKAKELLLERKSIPVVCGHELFWKLNSLQRGSSTLLNARLIPVIKAFIDAIKSAMTTYGIRATVVIVRSDGSLMSEEFAQTHPIETLLCGPAASVLGSAFSTHEKNSIVVDMGGTTTDIGVIKGGFPQKTNDGIAIGRWKTFVDGLYIKTIGLGGDTAVHYKDKKMLLEDFRVVPLCIAAEKHPHIIKGLARLVGNGEKHPRYIHEYLLLTKDIEGNTRYSEDERKLCGALKEGPLSLTEAAEDVLGKDVYNIKVSRLVKEGVIQVCGLTPTDIMHVKGDFGKFSRKASILGAQFVALNLEISVEELCDLVYDEVKRRLYATIVKVMLENNDGYYMNNGFNEASERFINESYDHAKSCISPALVSLRFTTDFALIGVGAPVHLFLGDVARMLGTRAVFPEHNEVANALGAIVGNVRASCDVEVKPNFTDAGMAGYIVYGTSETRVFKKREEAEDFALKEAQDGAYAEALNRGAQGETTISINLDRQEVDAKGCSIYLGSKATALAVGSMGILVE